jgi:hypothetical protein
MLPLSVASMTISSLTLNSCIGKQTKHILCQNTQLFLLCSANFNNSEQLKRSWNVYIHSNPCSPYCTEFLASLQHFAVHAPPDTPKPDERETSFRNIIDFSLSQNTKGNIDDFWKANNSIQNLKICPIQCASSQWWHTKLVLRESGKNSMYHFPFLNGTSSKQSPTMYCRLAEAHCLFLRFLKQIDTWAFASKNEKMYTNHHDALPNTNWYVKMLITMELQVIMVPKGESRMLQLCRNADFNTI